MKLGRIAAIVLAVATVGLLSGSAMAFVAGGPTTTPNVPAVIYIVPQAAPGHLAVFAPFLGVAQGPGIVQIHISSHNVWLGVYQLQGTGIIVVVPPMTTVTLMANIHQPGTYAWVTQIPSPGLPSGMTVGVLVVPVPT
jgi:hypothetical protein